MSSREKPTKDSFNQCENLKEITLTRNTMEIIKRDVPPNRGAWICNSYFLDLIISTFFVQLNLMIIIIDKSKREREIARVKVSTN